MARPRSDIRERVVEVALSAFLEKGVDGTSTREVARRAGTNIGMVYYYFPTKEDLFLAVVEDTYAELLQRMQIALDPAQAFESRLLCLYEFVGSLSAAETRVVQLVVREALASHSRMQSLFERFKRGHVPLLLDLMKQGFRDGSIDARHNPFIALACLAGIGIVPQFLVRVLAGRLVDFDAQPPQNDSLPGLLRDTYLRALSTPSRGTGEVS